MRGVLLPLGLLLAALFVAGCATAPVDGQLGRSDKFVVVQLQPGDTARSLALRYLGDSGKYWMIEDANAPEGLRTGRVAVIPLGAWNDSGVQPTGYQTVPVLAYHRLGARPSSMTMESSAFRRQMLYLRDNGYRVIPLSDLLQFLDGKRQLPAKAVVITFDDGHRSVYDLAFPMLRELGYPATFFVYTDYIGNGGVDPEQLREMSDSGLITVLPHSKTHSNLAVRQSGESDEAYRQRLHREVREAGDRLAKIVGKPMFAYAYPYGDANAQVMDLLQQGGYAMGFTVQKGGNPAFSPRLMLRRTMIYGNRGMDEFVASLDVYQTTGAK